MSDQINLPESHSPPEKGRHTSLQETGSHVDDAPSRSASTGDLQHLPHRPRERPRVRFTPGGESLDSMNQRSSFPVRDPSRSPSPKPLPGARVAPHRRQQNASTSYFPPSLLDTDISRDVTEEPH